MLNAVSIARHPAPSPALLAQARQLEGVFLNTLTSTMFSSIKTDGTFGGGFGEQTWRSMQSEQMADDIAKSGGIGLADEITRSLLDVQEAAQSPTAGNAAASAEIDNLTAPSINIDPASLPVDDNSQGATP